MELHNPWLSNLCAVVQRMYPAQRLLPGRAQSSRQPNPRRAGADPIAAGQLPSLLASHLLASRPATRSDLSATTLSLPGPHLITSR